MPLTIKTQRMNESQKFRTNNNPETYRTDENFCDAFLVAKKLLKISV